MVRFLKIGYFCISSLVLYPLLDFGTILVKLFDVIAARNLLQHIGPFNLIILRLEKQGKFAIQISAIEKWLWNPVIPQIAANVDFDWKNFFSFL